MLGRLSDQVCGVIGYIRFMHHISPQGLVANEDSIDDP